MSRVLVLKRGITHDLHASDIIWYHLVKGSVWSMSVVCRMSCFACIARISFWASLHAVRDCLHWHAPWCWTVFSSSWHTLTDTGNQPQLPACPIVIDIIVLIAPGFLRTFLLFPSCGIFSDSPLLSRQVPVNENLSRASSGTLPANHAHTISHF